MRAVLLAVCLGLMQCSGIDELVLSGPVTIRAGTSFTLPERAACPASRILVEGCLSPSPRERWPGDGIGDTVYGEVRSGDRSYPLFLNNIATGCRIELETREYDGEVYGRLVGIPDRPGVEETIIFEPDIATAVERVVYQCLPNRMYGRH